MRSASDELRAARKRMLLARSAVLRLSLTRQLGQGLSPAWRTLDRVDHGWRWIKSNPLVWAAAAGVALAWRPWRLVRAGARGLSWWQTWRRVAPVALPVLQAVLNRRAR